MILLLFIACGTAEFTLPKGEETLTETGDPDPADTNNGTDSGSDSGSDPTTDPTRDPDPETPGDLLVEVSFISPVASFTFFYAYCVDRELEECPLWSDAGTVNQEERSSFGFQAQSGHFGFDGSTDKGIELVEQADSCYLTQEVILWMDGVEVTALMRYYQYEQDCRAGISLDEASALAAND
jgi:hypothetical protein